MIRETVLLPIHPDKAATFEAIFAARRTRVLAEEPGTLKYDLLRSDQGEALYVVEEWFADEDAKAFHLANSTDHEPMMACFAGGFTVHRLTPVFIADKPTTVFVANISDPSDLPVEPRLEHMYRRGYVHGVAAAIEALRKNLSDKEYQFLETWIMKDLFAWSTTNLRTALRPPVLDNVSKKG